MSKTRKKPFYKKSILCIVCQMPATLYRPNGVYCSRKCLRKRANARAYIKRKARESAE